MMSRISEIVMIDSCLKCKYISNNDNDTAYCSNVKELWAIPNKKKIPWWCPLDEYETVIK